MRRLSRIWPALLVACLAIAAGAPSIGFDFVYDDQAVIVDRAPFWSEGLSTFATTRHWGTGRHATLISLDVDRLWGGGSPAAFHATNVALSALISLLVLKLALRIGLATPGAAAAAAIFAVHPVHVDAVASLVGRAELLAALGVLIVMLVAIAARGDERASPRQALAIAAISAAAAYAAFHSKESALCLPGLLVLARLAFPRQVRLWPALAGATLAGAAWALHVLPLAQQVVTPQYVDNPLAYEPFVQRILKASAVLLEYARLTLWPHPLLPDRSFAQTDPTTAAGAVALAVLLASGAAATAGLRRYPRLFFCVGWFAVAFAVTANIAFPTGTIMAERLLFLPSVGPCLAAGLLVERIATRIARGAAVAAAVTGAAVVILFAQFQARAAVWESAATYFPASAAASPRSAKAQYDLALWLWAQGRRDESFAAFERALSIHAAFSRAAFYLAERKAAAGDVAYGIRVYERYLQAMPEDTGALTNITRLLLDAGRAQEAWTYAQRLVAAAPESDSARQTLVVAETAAKRAARKAALANP
ncbi:MAG TPA: hypothetical protein VEC57_00745 [Candidatus Limnocylindrales bacterium]|nr:hypothetical protein [Candidatus Limnocylindrales bacterium]